MEVDFVKLPIKDEVGLKQLDETLAEKDKRRQMACVLSILFIGKCGGYNESHHEENDIKGACTENELGRKRPRLFKNIVRETRTCDESNSQ